MTKSKDNLAVLKAAKRKGVNPTKISKAQFINLALEAQGSFANQARAAKRAVNSRIRTGVMHHTMPAGKAEANKSMCMSCPHKALERLKDGSPACMACGCQGKFLESKWKDPFEHCPLTISGKRVDDVGFLTDDPPTWSNLEVTNADA